MHDGTLELVLALVLVLVLINLLGLVYSLSLRPNPSIRIGIGISVMNANFQLVKNMSDKIRTNANKSLIISSSPDENTSVIACISDTVLVTKEPTGLVSKYFILR